MIIFIMPLSLIFSFVNAEEAHGTDCAIETVDCSAHEAGYEWADLNSIDDVDDCSGNSDSFIDGCRAYVEANQLAENKTRATDETMKEQEGRSAQEEPATDASTDQPNQ
jgi:hypothetical protein